MNDSGIDLSADASAPPRRAAPREPLDNYRDESRDDLRETIPFEPALPPEPEPTQLSTLRWDAANWELNEKLRHVERLTAVGSSNAAAAVTGRGYRSPRSEFGSTSRRDVASSQGYAPHYPAGEAAPPSYEPPPFEPYSPHENPPAYPPLGAPYAPPAHPLPAHPYAPYAPSGTPPTHNEMPGWIEAAASLTSWLFLGLSVGTFCCGGFLAGWGAVAQQHHLEQLGMPIIFGGMLALVLGLLPQIFLRRIEESRERQRHHEPEYGRSNEAYGSRADRGTRAHYAPHADHDYREVRRPESAYYR